MTRPSRLSISLAAMLATMSVFATSCGSERSPEAYCKTFFSKAAPIRQRYVDQNKHADENPLGSIAMAFSVPGDMQSIFDAMVDHAPDDIKSDTVQVRDSFKKLRDTMGEAFSNPLGALGGGLVNSLTSAGAFNRVSAYLERHCPLDSEIAREYVDDTR